MTFEELFERAAGYDVDESAVVTALAERRDREVDDTDGGEDP